MTEDKIITTGTLATAILVAMLFSAPMMAETADAESPANDTADTSPAKPAVMLSKKVVVDISDWACDDCAFEEGYSGEIELGLGNVSDDAAKFGEYNGLNEKGGWLIVNGKARYRDLDAKYMDLSVHEFGLDSRSLNFEAGQQGNYDVIFSYDEISHFLSDSIVTPYRGNGSANLSLPAGWVAGGDTAGMTALATSLQMTDLDLQRRRLDLGMSFLTQSPWKYDVKFRRETREGGKRSAGAFFFNAAQLIEPVDYITDEVDVSAAYVGKQWQLSLAYYGSFFSNENKSLTFENAFTPMVAGADNGQRALPPDNLFHQLVLSTGYQLTEDTRLSGDIIVGRMEQDDDFLAATINSSLTVAGLPRTSADAQVDTLNGDLRLISVITDQLRLSASYNYADHDNSTPQSLYNWVSTDTFVAATSRTNQPYSFTRQQTKVNADYRFTTTTKLTAGVTHDQQERTLQDVDETSELTTWGKLLIRGMDFMDITFKLSRAERDVSDYQLVPEIDPAQNPLMRKYNMADRTRTTGGITANAMLGETVNVGLGVDFANDDYSQSTLGLTEASEVNINADISVMISENASVHAFAGRENIKSTQNGQPVGNPVWLAENDDIVDIAGVGIKHQLIEDKLDIGADYVLSHSSGKLTVSNGAADEFPELETDLDSLKIYADYQIEDNMSLHAAYWYEKYDTRDWMLDGVDPDTISNVLGFGEVSPSYKINVFTVSLRYKF
ncbi:MAG: MtrB/PioB family decaheme-associated outer membrane protein [Gammaproteobacteria bacterium]|nr:MtrB/PioB family decaheme-associated outer membrane protein [Gammaproteobacteria bacterium]